MRIQLLRVVIFAACWCSASCYSEMDVVYLIPKGYIGGVVIFFEQPDGIIPENQGGLTFYPIPEGGVLKVGVPRYRGMANTIYFYVDGNGNREQLKFLRITGSNDPNGKPKDKFDGQITKDEYENGIFVMSHEQTNSNVTSFTVGAPKDSDRLYEKMRETISNVQRKSSP